MQNAELLLEVLRGEVNKKDLQKRWEQIEKQRRQRKNKLEDQKWPCAMCAQQLPWTAYSLDQDANPPVSIQTWVLQPGSSRCCRKCLRGEPRGEAAELTEAYLCKLCQKTRPLKFFEKKIVENLSVMDEVQELVCVDCMTPPKN